MTASAPSFLILLRRLLAVLLIVIAVAVGAIYWRQERARKAERRPPPAPVKLSYIQTADQFGLSATSRDGHPLFRVTTDRAEQLRVGNQWVLHHVHIMVYAPDGVTVADDIRGEQFAYDQKTDTAVAQGEVQIDLNSRPAVPELGAGESGVLPAHLAPPSPVHLVAQDLVFNSKTGAADVSQGVQFHYETATGEAAGAHLERAMATLSGGVHLVWNPPGRDAVTVTADGARLDRETNEVRLEGRVEATEPGQRLGADQLVLRLERDYSLRGAVADGHVRVDKTDANGGAAITATAAHADADFEPALHGGNREIGSLRLQGAVTLRQHASANLALDAARVDVAFAAGNAVRRAVAVGDGALPAHVLMSPGPGITRAIAAPEIDLTFAPAQADQQPPLQAVDTHGATRIDLAGGVSGGPSAAVGGAELGGGPLRVDASPTFHLDLDAQQQPESATAGPDSVRVEQAGPLGPSVATGHALTLQFSPSSDGADKTGKVALDRVILRGEVAATEPQPGGERRLRADEIVASAADGRMQLIAEPGSLWTHGRVSGSDPHSQFSAAAATVVQQPGSGQTQIDASGAVQAAFTGSEWFRAAASAPRGGTAKDAANPPIAAIADRARLDSQSGEGRSSEGAAASESAELTGHVRIWQGGNVLLADHATLDGGSGQISADGHVTTEYLATAGAIAAAMPGARAGSGARGPSAVSVSAERLHYDNEARKADYSGAVQVRSQQVQMRSDRLQIWLTANGAKPAIGASAATELDHMVASGHVRAVMGTKTGTAAEARYDQGTQMAIFTGGEPRICDAEQGCLSGEPLTYSLLNAEIRIGSKTGAPATGQVQIH